MIKFYVIREKSTGKFLGAKSSGRRKFVESIEFAAFWTRKASCSNAMNFAPGLNKFYKDNGKVFRMRGAARDSRLFSSFPVEIVEFNALLVDAKKGYIG